MNRLSFLPGHTRNPFKVKYLNKKRTRKGWVKVDINSFSGAAQVEHWCRQNRTDPSRWYKSGPHFWFEKEAIATFIMLRWG